MRADGLRLLARLIASVSARDKLLKLVQYAAKLYLMGAAGKEPRSLAGLRSLVSALSLARLVYRLGDWAGPLADSLGGLAGGPAALRSLPLLEAVLSSLNCLLDDLVCLHRCTGGAWPPLSAAQQRALELASSHLWLATILINMRLTRPQLRPAGGLDPPLAMAKLLCDAVFCLYDIHGWQRLRRLPVLCGILSAGLGAYRAARKIK